MNAPRTAGENNRAIYDEFWAACSDFSRYNPGARHRRRILGEIVDKLAWRSVLDVGCGDGQNLLFLRAHGGHGIDGTSFTGVDLSPKTVEENAKKYPFAKFAALDIEHAALSAQFDLVTCCEVIEHLDKPEDAVNNLARQVSPGGHLVLTCPTGKVHATEKHWGHVAHPQTADLKRMFADAGLEIVSIENWGFPFYVGLKYATNVSAKWAVENFGTGNYSPLAKAVSTALYFANFLNLKSSPLGCEFFVLARKRA
jgi:2-polyprenyl-3-methyl-5-hydroxy-6-metoxy-1,4-benzoquinol methylase